jgi:oxygen-independent coproporphyrinogen-3 oxidase
VRGDVDEGRWRAALVSEIEHAASRTPGREVTSVFFGGGTPSLLASDTVAAVIEAVSARWDVIGEAEITLEANPISVEAGRFAAYAEAGVNRLSIGVQSLEDSALAFLGREHSAAEARDALEVARRQVARISLDLIYARPYQTVADWSTELGDALNLAGGHLSLYQLTVEPGTPFHGAWRRGQLVPPAQDDGARLYEATQAICEATTWASAPAPMAGSLLRASGWRPARCAPPKLGSPALRPKATAARPTRPCRRRPRPWRC